MSGTHSGEKDLTRIIAHASVETSTIIAAMIVAIIMNRASMGK
jgi:hypothetical protein